MLKRKAKENKTMKAEGTVATLTKEKKTRWLKGASSPPTFKAVGCFPAKKSMARQGMTS